MERHIVLLAVAGLLWVPGTLQATIIELPLDGAGTYGYGDLWETDFDLGVEFIKIKTVLIKWSGEITGALGVHYSNPEDPIPVNVGIWASFDNDQYVRFATVKGGRLTYPNPELFDTTSLIELIFDATWSDLLDGKGHAKFFYTQPWIMDGYIIETGSVCLNDAKLIVHGTLVPEPSSMILLTLGVVGVLRRRNKMFHKS